jgi:hypothetical protein
MVLQTKIKEHVALVYLDNGKTIFVHGPSRTEWNGPGSYIYDEKKTEGLPWEPAYIEDNTLVLLGQAIVDFDRTPWAKPHVTNYVLPRSQNHENLGAIVEVSLLQSSKVQRFHIEFESGRTFEFGGRTSYIEPPTNFDPTALEGKIVRKLTINSMYPTNELHYPHQMMEIQTADFKITRVSRFLMLPHHDYTVP